MTTMRRSAVTKGLALVVAVALAPLVEIAHAQTGRGGSYAQRLLRDVVQRHPEIKGMELAGLRGNGCVTIAATDEGDIGDRCDDKERRALRTKEPYVEDPSEFDPAYIITEALHDASGRVVGVIIMDLVPERGGRAAALARARTIRLEVESRIPSAARLNEGTPAGRRRTAGLNDA
jgi:hypothetical protein